MSSFPSVQILFILTAVLTADPGAKLITPKAEAWTGQRVPLFVELRAEGSFKGAASFDLPEIPNTVIIKIGSPTLSSETTGDAEVFVQRHEFALFSQSSGSIQIPPITARYSHLKGYTGPTFDASEKTAAITLTIKRPPNSDTLGFIVSTPSLEVEESWHPTPGPLETGTVLKRTIVQRANQMTGIALKPAPTPDIEGVRSYASQADVTDKTERGEFLGERKETITYLIQQPGLHTLPEFRYDWWNPSSETLETRSFPAVTFTATSPPPPPAKPSPARYLWLISPALVLVAIAIYRKQLTAALHRFHQWIDPPSQRSSRAFLKACASNDPNRATKAWEQVRTHHLKLNQSENLISEIRTLYECSFGTDSKPANWSGEALAQAYREAGKQAHPSTKQAHLPKLNP